MNRVGGGPPVRAGGEGRVALVTGAGEGIGRAIVRAIAGRGHTVVLNDVDLAVAARAASLLTSEEPSVHIVPYGGDAADPLAMRALVTEVVERFGRLDVAVVNAGLFHQRPFLAEEPADVDRLLALNVRGAYFTAQAAARAMAGCGHGGRIVFIGSAVGLQPVDGLSAYGMTKAALVHLAAAGRRVGPHRHHRQRRRPRDHGHRADGQGDRHLPRRLGRTHPHRPGGRRRRGGGDRVVPLPARRRSHQRPDPGGGRRLDAQQPQPRGSASLRARRPPGRPLYGVSPTRRSVGPQSAARRWTTSAAAKVASRPSISTTRWPSSVTSLTHPATDGTVRELDADPAADRGRTVAVAVEHGGFVGPARTGRRSVAATRPAAPPGPPATGQLGQGHGRHRQPGGHRRRCSSCPCR